MANKSQAASALDVATIKPETPQMELYLAAGYPGMTVAKAKTIIAERKQNPAAWPYEMLEKAQAFLEAYSARPQVISPDRGSAKVARARADANAA
jgi:hypothetical protein